MEERSFGVSFFFFIYFIYLFLAALSLCYSAGFSLVAESRRLLSSCSMGVPQYGGSSCRGAQGSRHSGLGSCGARAQ